MLINLQQGAIRNTCSVSWQTQKQHGSSVDGDLRLPELILLARFT